ncbi:hypothetical protein C0J52_24302, partial [Blattella germanica]
YLYKITLFCFNLIKLEEQQIYLELLKLLTDVDSNTLPPLWREVLASLETLSPGRTTVRAPRRPAPGTRFGNGRRLAGAKTLPDGYNISAKQPGWMVRKHYDISGRDEGNYGENSIPQDEALSGKTFRKRSWGTTTHSAYSFEFEDFALTMLLCTVHPRNKRDLGHRRSQFHQRDRSAHQLSFTKSKIYSIPDPANQYHHSTRKCGSHPRDITSRDGAGGDISSLSFGAKIKGFRLGTVVESAAAYNRVSYQQQLHCQEISSVPILTPGLIYKFETVIECIAEIGISDQVRIFIARNTADAPFPEVVQIMRMEVTQTPQVRFTQRRRIVVPAIKRSVS